MTETSSQPKRTTQQRLTAMAILLGAVAAYAFYTQTLPWYHFSFSADVVTAETYETVEGVVAERDILGSELATLELATGPMQVEMPVGPMGLLMPVAWLFAGAIAGLATAFLRNGFFSLAGGVAFYMSYTSLSTVREAMENPSYGGDYNTPAEGMSQFTLALFFSLLLVLMIGFQAVVVNRRIKAERRAAGEEIPPTIIETIGSLKLASVARVASTVIQEASDTKEAAKTKASSKN